MPSNGRNTPVLNVAVTSWDVLAAGAATSSVRFAGSVACPLPSALCLLRRPPHPAPAAQVVVTLSLRRHLGGYLCPCGGWSPFETEGRAAVPQVGERLGRYEVEKRCAVEKEDYDLAKEKKQQMELFRSRVYEQLQLHSLVDGELVGAPAPAAVQAGGPGPVSVGRAHRAGDLVGRGTSPSLGRSSAPQLPPCVPTPRGAGPATLPQDSWYRTGSRAQGRSLLCRWPQSHSSSPVTMTCPGES